MFSRDTFVCMCVLRLFIPIHVGTSDAVHAVSPYPVHDEDLADVEFVLKLLGSDGHGVEETKAPVDKQTREERRPHVFIRTSSAN